MDTSDFILITGSAGTTQGLPKNRNPPDSSPAPCPACLVREYKSWWWRRRQFIEPFPLYGVRLGEKTQFFEVPAKHVVDQLEFHYTPKHSSWLNMADIEFGILQRQCFNCRMPGGQPLREEVAAWQGRRNADAVDVNWWFTIEDPHITHQTQTPLSINRLLTEH